MSMKRLDQHKMFPFVAWVVIVAFAIFTYELTARVEALDASKKTQKTEAAIENIDEYFSEPGS